ncbi:MAG: GNAT family N-acetyltransferase [Dehalococcoidia bacterium]|nr:GNAT family N-acetyltransferase [Dehalococcoidia bacterium]
MDEKAPGAVEAEIRASRPEDTAAIATLIARQSFRADGSGSLIPVGADGIRAVIADEGRGRFFTAISATGDVAGCCSFVVYGLPVEQERLLASLRTRLTADHLEGHLRLLNVERSPAEGTIAELRSLAVDDGSRGRGLGLRLIEATKVAARERGFRELYALVNAQSLPVFERAGFRRTVRTPQKLLRDCVSCPILEHCAEIPVVVALA